MRRPSLREKQMFKLSENDRANDWARDLQSRFFSGNVLARTGKYKTEQDVDKLRDAVTKPFRSKKYKKDF